MKHFCHSLTTLCSKHKSSPHIFPHSLSLSFFPYCQCKPHQIHDYSPSLFLSPPPLWSFDWLLTVKSPIDNDSIQPSWPSSVIDSRFKWLSCSFAIHLPPVPLPLCYLTGNHLPERFVVQSKWCHMKWASTCALWVSKHVVFSLPLLCMQCEWELLGNYVSSKVLIYTEIVVFLRCFVYCQMKS